MKRILAIIEPLIVVLLIGLALRYLTVPITQWLAPKVTCLNFSDSGLIFGAVFIICAIGIIEIAFFYRLRRLGAKQLGLSSRFTALDIALIPAVGALSAGLFFLVWQIIKFIPQLSTISLPLPHSTSDWILFVPLVILVAGGGELAFRGFTINIVETRGKYGKWVVLVVSIIASALPSIFIPGLALAFAMTAIPLGVYYIWRRNFWGNVIAAILMYTILIILQFTGIIS